MSIIKKLKILLSEKDGKLLDKPTWTPEKLAMYHKVDLNVILQQLKQGISVESEHTSHKEVAREIALDHLKEDPYYYSQLAKVEKD